MREGCSVILMLAAAGGGFAVVCVLGWGLVAAGLRAGDRPGDAAVAAVLVPGPRPAIIATVRNPGDVPVVAGLTVRRPLLPGWPGAGWPGAGLTVRVPRRTTLRVISVPVVSGGPARAGRPAPAARAADRD
jgi:hypothetical protein